MLKSISRALSAVIAAAAIAGALTVLPGASEKVSASTPLNSGKGDRLDYRAVGPDCSQLAWPFYEATCVKDRRQAMNQAKAARIVTAERAPKAIKR
jgi:hypothetical protein